MTNAPENSTAPEPTPDINSVPGRASWGGSVASAEPAPEGAGSDLHRGAQVLQASTEGGSKPGQEEQQSTSRVHRQLTPRARQRPRQPREKKRLHQPNTRFNDDEFTLIKSAAAQCHLSVAGFLARSALAAARDLDRTSAEIADEREVITALFDSRRRLGWAGSNLNQIAKALNSGADAPHLEAAIAAVRRAADTAHDAATRLIEGNDS
ncbi:MULTISPECIES: plasmid mobilization protein [unclassified Streptomyces]|uniref:plasmid mobilization protein n=1 Tax=unclassified Streptomyces TaxID=2593676 RepID=UPI0009CF6EF0|nr:MULTISPECIES: plasmid mobilization relaxosome protein MobC [unclassified Streptomyces]ONI49911.1 Bacterial mobilization protein (MobC) [Streptomyces sp. IB2014 011-1]